MGSHGTLKDPLNNIFSEKIHLLLSGQMRLSYSFRGLFKTADIAWKFKLELAQTSTLFMDL